MIFTITLNPAVDKILFVEDFQRSRTNRLSRTLETIGGKGTHVSINLKLQNVPSTALGISLGENGKKIIKLLEQWGVASQFLHYDIAGMESRTNYEIVESAAHTCTMLTERGPLLPTRITNELLVLIQGLLKAGDMLVLTGDASNVEDATIYSRLAHVAGEHGAKVFLDASGPYLKEGLNSNPYLIKPNFEEMCFLAGRDLKTEAEIIAAMQELDRFNIPVIAMTWASKGAIIKSGQDFYRAEPFNVHARNEGGCGDAFLSGIVAGIEKKMEMEAILQLATSVAAAAAESENTAGFDPLRAKEIEKQVVVVRIQ